MQLHHAGQYSVCEGVAAYYEPSSEVMIISTLLDLVNNYSVAGPTVAVNL